jgi:transposase
MQKYVLFIGIDISKRTIDVALSLTGRENEMDYQQFSNDKIGFKKLLSFIRKTASCPKDKSQWFFCMEHTGVYTYPLCRFLEQHSLSYTLVNPYHLKHSMGLRRGKSDKADAKAIARFAYQQIADLKPTKMEADKYLTIKSLLSLRARLVKNKHGLQVSSKELAGFANKSVSQSISKFSQRSMGHTDKLIQEVEQQILRIISKDKEFKRLYDLLLSVKGVGPIIASALIVYTVAFTAFKTSRQFAVYIGIVPFDQTSGTSIKTPAKVSHLAHKKLKGLISSGASIARVHDKELRAYYERRLSEGKNKFVIQNAIRNKFLHRIFAVVKRGTPYVELAQHRTF